MVREVDEMVKEEEGEVGWEVVDVEGGEVCESVVWKGDRMRVEKVEEEEERVDMGVG